MRRIFVLTVVAAVAATAAHAQSADEADGSSISVITCETCGPTRDEKVRSTYELFAGPEIEIREVDGERKVFRTDNMFGGSPVTTVTSATLMYGAPDETELATPETGTGKLAADGSARPPVDSRTRTSSVEQSGLDLDDLHLRLN